MGILQSGTHISYEGQPQLCLSKNLASAFEDPKIITNKLQDDLRLHRVVKATPVFPFISSPLGLVPKHDGGWRRIHHLSFPDHTSVNDGIPKPYSTIDYITVDTIFELVVAAGKNCLIIKRDIKDAFRNVPVASKYQWLLGFKWQGIYYKETCLPFGLATAPAIFNLFANAFEWILRCRLKWHSTVHYLDNFIRILPESEAHSIPQAAKDYIQLTNTLSLPHNNSKDCCSTVVEVLGIELNTFFFEARLSPQKIAKALTVTSTTLLQDSLSQREAQKLAGYLSYCCKVVRLGRVFLSSAWEFLGGNFPSSTAKRRIPRCFKDDLLWWNETLPRVNGILFFDDSKRLTMHLFTDACLKGLGGFYYKSGSTNWRKQIPRITQTNAFSINIPQHARSEGINSLELLAILYALEIWKDRLSRCHLVVHTDNTTAFHSLQSLQLRGASNKPLRRCLHLAATADITIKPVWLSSADNALADALSRHNCTTVTNICPHWQTPLFSTTYPNHFQLP